MLGTEARESVVRLVGRGAFRSRVKPHRKDVVDEAEVRMPV